MTVIPLYKAHATRRMPLMERTDENFAEALAALRRGEVVVYPTETLYGLGANALDGGAVERVFHLKGRPANNPISVLIADREMLRSLVTNIPPKARKLIEEFWPGPLTLVLQARNQLPNPLLNSTGGIAVRISSQSLATRLVRALGHPLTATSANPSGQEPARTIEQAQAYFAGQIKVFLDGGALQSKTGSTVVEVTGERLAIIREGEVTASTIRHVLGEAAP